MTKNNSGDKAHNQQSVRQSSGAAEKAARLASTTGCTDASQIQRQDCPIVGIGASAGGLQALVQLFEGVAETTGMAFVVIQHLDANNDSALSDILSKATAMSVSEVKDHAVAQPNQVYVIAPGTELRVSNGVLTVVLQKSSMGRYTPIDSFLESLAMDRENKAFGVILSGNGADGVQGIKAIKAAGGIAFAQTPQSARYDSMPRSAIATGMVDFILEPLQIAGELSRLGQSQMIINSISEGTELFPDGAEALDRIIALLHKVSGINFAEYKQFTIKRRIMRRMILLKIERIDDYVAHLWSNAAELTALQQDMLINVTNFFRDQQAFETLKKVVFPSIVSTGLPNVPIRLWVPGCSTGEEAYSLAIALLEFLEENNVDQQIQIFATDINEKVIEKARAGIYPKTIVSDVSTAQISRFFVEVEQGYQVSKTIRDICVFARQDIGQDPPISRVDLISCRNVMIYFGPALHKRIFPIFHYALNPNCFLMLGSSESIGVFADLFGLVDKKHRIYTKKSVTTPMIFDFSAAEHAASIQNRRKADVDGFSGDSWVEVHKEADRIVLGKYAPSGVIINSKLDIIQFRGRTGVYLEPAPGMPSVNLLKMARDGLFAGLRAAVNQAKKENAIVKKEGLHLFKNGYSFSINVDVVPINGSFQRGEYFLVLFQDVASHTELYSAVESGTSQEIFQSGAAEEARRLKQEVAATKEYLQSIIDQHEVVNEDLRYANEEVQSSNEELQSINEEMETAKEELQSTNEELMTLNEELRTRNMELNHVNNDMINLLRSINLPVLILSSDLRIRRFNSLAEKVFNLIGADVGRPIGNIKPNIDVPDLEQASLQVIDTLNSTEQEVQDRTGHWYSMQIRPYWTTDNKIDGVIITFADIDAIKRSIRVIQEAREYAEAIVETVRHPMVVLDTDLCLKTANKAFYQTFQMTPEELTGQSIFQIKDSQWNLLELCTLLTDLLDHDTTFEDFVITGDLPDNGNLTMVINARRIVNLHDHAKLILMSFETITL